MDARYNLSLGIALSSFHLSMNGKTDTCEYRQAVYYTKTGVNTWLCTPQTWLLSSSNSWFYQPGATCVFLPVYRVSRKKANIIHTHLFQINLIKVLLDIGIKLIESACINNVPFLCDTLAIVDLVW